MDHIVAGGRAAPVGVATDGSGDELRRPGDDVILGGQGLLVYGALVFVVAGAVPPAWVLWRRRVQADGSG